MRRGMINRIIDFSVNTKKNSLGGKKMNPKKMLGVAIVSLLVALMIVNVAFSQTKADHPAGKKPRVAPTITITGTIIKDTVGGGYKVIRKKPHEEYKVSNVNDKILKDLADKGELVKVEASLPRGAYFLFIEKINGKEYSR
jgi:flagellar basal body-associated protein FliL